MKLDDVVNTYVVPDRKVPFFSNRRSKYPRFVTEIHLLDYRKPIFLSAWSRYELQ
jgi:hypothetical protein